MIQIQALSKHYGELVALDRLELEIQRGEWFLYLGLNGAGKSTTMRLLLGLAEATAGGARVAGCDPWREGPALRAKVGYLPEDFTPYEHLTGREYLQFIGDMHRLGRRERDRRASALLELLDLEDAAEVHASQYSHGMRKKLGLAAALLHEPEVLVLDEPTAELDPRAASLVRGVLRGLADRGVTIMMSTHILGVAEKQCDRVGILHRARLAAVGTTDEILAAHPGLSLEQVFLHITGAADEAKIQTWLEERSA